MFVQKRAPLLHNILVLERVQMVVPPVSVRPYLGDYMFVQKREPLLHNILVLERVQMVVPPVRPYLGDYVCPKEGTTAA